MRKFKIITTIVLICSLLTAFASLSLAAQNPLMSATPPTITGAGSYNAAEEVIYALLDGSGMPENIWVVGALDVTAPGDVTVYGDFTDIKNLTSTRPVDYSNGTLTANADVGRFYWQGTPVKAELPWNIAIRYMLNGLAVAAGELAGAEGQFELLIETSQFKGANADIFENYMLQITITLDTSLCKNIIADGATVANSGNNKTFAFTVLPGANGSLKISADVTDFELADITFAAVPYSIELELGDLSGYTSDFTKLAEAITVLNDGIKELNGGAAALSDGASKLASGSNDYKSGLSQISAGGAALKSGSEAIIAALGGFDSADMSSLKQLPAALRLMAAGLDGISATLDALSGGYSQALGALAGAIASIPEASVSEADIYAFMTANPNNKTVAALVENYQAAQTVKGTYAAVSEAFSGVDTALPAMKTGITEISSGLTAIATQIDAGLNGANLGDMAAQYTQFHDGLTAYIDGVTALAGGYTQLSSGISELAGGVSELKDGVNTLSDGMNELDEETSQLPDKIDDMIDEMTPEFTGGDYEPVSFLSDKNEKVSLVQFVFRTDAVKLPPLPAAVQPEPEAQTFWSRLINLFMR